MRPEEVTEDWLIAANKRYRANGIEPALRPMKAIGDICDELNSSIVFGSPAERKISDWFRENTKPEAHVVGSLFTGAFFFDACFWEVRIALGFGVFHLNPLDALIEMPPPILSDLEINTNDLKSYFLYWADCMDYGYGIAEITQLSHRAHSFIGNGHKELLGCYLQLNTSCPNSKAILAARMVCEIFTKSLLIQEKGYMDKDLKRVGHGLVTAAQEAFQAVALPAFELLEKQAYIFPDVSERYDGGEIPLPQLWEAISVAQAVASAVIRQYSGRDIRSQVTSSKPFI